MIPREKLLETLKRHWGYERFRPLQLETIEDVCAGRDTLVLMPTGGGKSVVYQVPALASEGVCVVVTPLIALMKDQIDRLRSRRILAESIHSGMSPRDIDRILDNCVYGSVKFLYIAPERIDSELFRTRFGKMRVSLLAVDEAHCISQWGYDFRPSYLRIARLRELQPDVPVLALTASATPEVAEDIMRRLKFREPHVRRMSFERANLSYVVRRTEDKHGQLLRIVGSVPGPGIVYVRTREKAETITAFLNEHGIAAGFYHGGMNYLMRSVRRRRVDQRNDARHGRNQRIRHGDRQGRRPFRRALRRLRLARGVLPRSRASGTRRQAGLRRHAAFGRRRIESRDDAWSSTFPPNRRSAAYTKRCSTT